MFPLHDRVSVDGSYSFSAQHELSSLLWCDAGYAPGVRSTQPVVVAGVIFKTHFLLDSFWLGSWQSTEICVCHLKNGGKLSETVYGFCERFFFSVWTGWKLFRPAPEGVAWIWEVTSLCQWQRWECRCRQDKETTAEILKFSHPRIEEHKTHRLK